MFEGGGGGGNRYECSCTSREFYMNAGMICPSHQHAHYICILLCLLF